MNDEGTVILSGRDLAVLSGSLIEVTIAIWPDNLIDSVRNQMPEVKELDRKVAEWNAQVLSGHQRDDWDAIYASQMPVLLTNDEQRLLCAVVENTILALGREL